jgi:hypothetical protein
MAPNGTLAAELRELDKMMERRHEKLRNVLTTLKDGISGLPVRDPRSVKKIETHLHLIDLSFEEVDREQMRYREWLDLASQNRSGISDETLGRLREYRRKIGAETDEEMIEELLRVVEVRSR